MSFRQLQFLRTGLLIIVMLAIVILSFLQGNRTIDYFDLMVDVHTPSLDGLDEITHLLDYADKNIVLYQNILVIDSIALTKLVSRMNIAAVKIDALKSKKIQTANLTDSIRNILNITTMLNADSSSEHINILEAKLLSLSTNLKKTYQSSSNNLKSQILPYIKIISTLNSNTRSYLKRYSQQNIITEKQLLEPLEKIHIEIYSINKVLTKGEQLYLEHSRNLSVISIEQGQMHEGNGGDNIIEQMNKISEINQQLIQTVNIYIDEKASMDPSASQVINTLKKVYQLVDLMKHRLRSAQNFYRQFVIDQQKKLQKETEDRQFSFILFLLFGIVIALGGQVMINRIVTKEMDTLQIGANKFTSSDFKYRISGLRLHEFKIIADSFNNMANDINTKDASIVSSMIELDAANKEILGAKHNLENQVALRTEELQGALQAANDSEKAKSDFLANMSHELRTPLHGIMSFTDFGLEKVGNATDDKIRTYFEHINNSSQRLKLLVDDLLDLSKLDAGKMEFDMCMNDMPAIVQQCAAEQGALLKSKNINFETKFDENIPLIECDKNRIGQVVMNLLNNAIKFSPEGSEIILAGYLTEFKTGTNTIDAIEIDIIDQGPGIQEDEKLTIFKKFTQSSKNEFSTGGTGLGLAICKELIQAHHGEIGCDNAVNGGSIFHFIIPIKQS